MDYTFEGNRVILETQLELGLEAKSPNSCTQSFVCSLVSSPIK